ncbi:hypothetical protein DYB31_002739 [Aphanomyces astaci]|uniref:Uncharacterized protein n=1 Tax=Aphanomyces astaci TaxID=112090 RepID=A0A397FWB5_APHAT|nr:hypothetical protein DYB31_002739 [Aphanomyces astaci]
MMRPQVLDTPAAFSTGPAMTPVALRKNPLENEGLLDDKDKNTADIDADLESRVDDVALDSTKSSSKSDADLIGDGKNDPSKEDKRVKYSGSRFVSRAFAIVGVLLFAGAVAFGVFFFKDDILQLLNKQSVGSASLSNETNATAAASLNSSDALSLASHPNGTFTTDQPTQASPSVTPDVITKVTLPVTTSSPSTTTSTPTTTASSATTTTNLKLPTPAPTVRAILVCLHRGPMLLILVIPSKHWSVSTHNNTEAVDVRL